MQACIPLLSNNSSTPSYYQKHAHWSSKARPEGPATAAHISYPQVLSVLYYSAVQNYCKSEPRLCAKCSSCTLKCTLVTSCSSNMWLTLHRQASQSNRDPYSSQSQAAPQPGSARGAQMAQKRPWQPSMGLVPSSQTGSIPPRPATTSGMRRLARPADAQTASQPRVSFSQPNSFQDYTPTGTPDRQYMMPGDQTFTLPQLQTHHNTYFLV